MSDTSMQPDPSRSTAGVRSALYVGTSEPFRATIARSVGLISAASGAAASSEAVVAGVNEWPCAVAERFDSKYESPATGVGLLPATSVTFRLGDDAYYTTDDGVPGTTRVRRKCSGSYSFNTSFPLVISQGELSSVYDDARAVATGSNLGRFLRNSPGVNNKQPRLSCITMATSQQVEGVIEAGMRLYPCVLQEFSVDASGIGSQGGAPPISCQMVTRGILNKYLGSMDYQLKHSFPKYAVTDPILGMTQSTGFSRDGRAEVHVKGQDPTRLGGRLANIKDCVVTLDGVKYDQVVRMKLQITHQLDFVPGSRGRVDGNMDLISHAQSVYLSSRVVKGSFSFLASNSMGGLRNSAGFPVTHQGKSTATGLRSGQWSSPLYMAFGPLIFNMPAVYWQPVVQEMTVGSSLVTIEFLARSDIVGGTEFL